MSERDKVTDRLTDAFVRLAEKAVTPEDRGALVADIILVYAEVLSTIIIEELRECDCTFCRKAQGSSAEEVHRMAQELSCRLINTKLDARGLRPMYAPEVPSDLNVELRKEILKELDT